MFLFFFSFIASHNVFLYYWSRCCFCCSVYVYCREQSKSNVVLSWYEMINALCMCTKIQVPSERKNSLGSPIRKKNFLFAISCLRLLTICTGRSDQFARTSVTNQRTQTFTSLIYIFCIYWICVCCPSCCHQCRRSCFRMNRRLQLFFPFRRSFCDRGRVCGYVSANKTVIN